MKSLCKFYLGALLVVVSVLGPTSLRADNKTTFMHETTDKGLADKLRELNSRIEKLEGKSRVMSLSSNGVNYSFTIPYEVGIGFIIGVICALWAQNNRRNAWLWFFLGIIFAPITLCVILAKNGRLRREEREARHVMVSPPSIPPP